MLAIGGACSIETMNDEQRTKLKKLDVAPSCPGPGLLHAPSPHLNKFLPLIEWTRTLAHESARTCSAASHYVFICPITGPMGPTTTSASGPTAAAPTQSQQQQQQQPRRLWRLAAVIAIALALTAVLAAALLVPRNSKERQSASPSTTGGSPVTPVRSVDLTTVTNALLVANSDMHDQVAAAAMANTTMNTIVTTPATPSKDGFFSMFTDGNTASEGVAIDSSAVGAYAWKALAGAAGSVCTPKNAAELVEFVTSTTSCTVILLRQSGRMPYNITKTMNVTSTKILIGNPIDLPTIQAVKGVHRLFDVHAGGRLDTRFLQLMRAPATKLDDGLLIFYWANTVLVRLGGEFTATGCVLGQKIQTVEMFLEDLEDPRMRVRMFGGHIGVTGGNVFLTGCVVYKIVPYGAPIVNHIQIGRDILVLAGNVVFTGVINVLGNLATSSINFGNIAAVFGGTVIWVGGANIGAGVIHMQYGAGQNIWVVSRSKKGREEEGCAMCYFPFDTKVK